MGYLALVFNSYHMYNLSHVKFSGSQKASQGSRGSSPSHGPIPKQEDLPASSNRDSAVGKLRAPPPGGVSGEMVQLPGPNLRSCGGSSRWEDTSGLWT